MKVYILVLPAASNAYSNYKGLAIDEQWDGFYGVSTNSRSLDPREVLGAYHNLWRIEEDFRIMKDYFQTRPMFHWTERRISGHIMLNFIAMIFERYLEGKLVGHGAKLSAEKIRVAINAMQKSVLHIDQNKFVSYANLPANSITILKNLEIKIPRSYMLN